MTRRTGDPLIDDLQAPRALRRFGSGWYAGLFGLLLGIAALALVLVLRFPTLLATPQLAMIREAAWFRPLVHLIILAAYAFAVLSLMLRQRKALGLAGLGFALAAALTGGGSATPAEIRSWGVFFGLDFFVLNMALTGLMFAPLERLFPLRREQRLFRPDWREDLFYFLVSSMLVQVIAFLTFAPSNAILDWTGQWGGLRARVAAVPLPLQILAIMVLTDLVQYWLHRAFHVVPWLWRFHAVHHSVTRMDWLAGSRLHLFEIAVVRGLTTVPMLTLGFAPAAVQAYVAIVYVHSSLIHANLAGDLDRLGRFIATPRWHHWHHAVDAEAIDCNFAIHFPWLDRLFGTAHYPAGRWPRGYGVRDEVPPGYFRQFLYPLRR